MHWIVVRWALVCAVESADIGKLAPSLLAMVGEKMERAGLDRHP